jgi:hypothetical protein
MTDIIRQLEKIFSLDPGAGEKAVLKEAARCAAIAADHSTRAEEAAIVSQLIHDSAGALDEKRARQVIANRGGFAAAMKRKKS